MARMLNGEQGVIQFGMPTVLAAKVTQPPTPDAPNTWTEVWTIKRYNGSVDYQLKFTAHPELGGSDVLVTPIDMPAPRPG